MILADLYQIQLTQAKILLPHDCFVWNIDDPSQVLKHYIQKNGWYIKSFDKPLSARKAIDGKARGRKIEVLTANYPIDTTV